MKRTIFSFSTAYAFAALLGMAAYAVCYSPQGEVWKGAAWSVTFFTLILANVAVFDSVRRAINSIKRKRK